MLNKSIHINSKINAHTEVEIDKNQRYRHRMQVLRGRLMIIFNFSSVTFPLKVPQVL